eukprot:m.351774 g.351774  ORF g.351774 m.351774 type:complete len:324 (+) comp19898_c3_seq1:1694-2665(+)
MHRRWCHLHRLCPPPRPTRNQACRPQAGPSEGVCRPQRPATRNGTSPHQARHPRTTTKCHCGIRLHWNSCLRDPWPCAEVGCNQARNETPPNVVAVMREEHPGVWVLLVSTSGHAKRRQASARPSKAMLEVVLLVVVFVVMAVQLKVQPVVDGAAVAAQASVVTALEALPHTRVALLVPLWTVSAPPAGITGRPQQCLRRRSAAQPWTQSSCTCSRCNGIPATMTTKTRMWAAVDSVVADAETKVLSCCPLCWVPGSPAETGTAGPRRPCWVGVTRPPTARAWPRPLPQARAGRLLVHAAPSTLFAPSPVPTFAPCLLQLKKK